MAINFTAPKRKNVDLSFTSSTDILATLTSSLERGVTTLEVKKPQGFTLSSPNDAFELNTILADAEIAFQADGQGFTNGGSVSTWTNNGTKGSTHDAVSGGDASRDPIYDTDDASNPFTTTGAIYFEDDQAQGSEGNPSSSHFLSLSNRYSAQNDMTLYVVAAYEDGFMPSKPPTIIETFIDISDSDGLNPPIGSGVDINSETHHGYVMSFQTPTSDPSVANWSDGGVNKFTIVDKDTATGTTGGAASDPGETFDLKLDITEPFTSGTPEVFVVRKLATSGDVFIYNGIGSQVGFISGGTDDSAGVGINPISFTVDMDGFGRQKQYVGSFIFSSSLLHNKNFADGKGVYVAALGAFNKDIGDQKSKALGRLLGEKYLP